MNRIGSNKTHGLSLLETLLAFFVLASASLLVIILFHSGLQRSRAIHVESQAYLIARETTEQIRAEMREGGFKSASDVAAFQRTYPYPEDTMFQVSVAARPADLLLDSSGQEREYSDTEKRQIKGSAAKVQVTVTWNSGAKTVRLVTLMAEAPRRLASVTVTGSGPISAGGRTRFDVQASDSDGLPIKDGLSFIWWVEPMSATGTVVPDRDTRGAEVVNLTRLEDGTLTSTVGVCKVAALATYENQEVIGYSPVINMVP